MKERVCPKCGKHNLEDAWNCIDCGETLSIKTLIDTESKQALAVTPIAGHTSLSEISSFFEQDVTTSLRDPIRIDETIVWGCNYTILSKNPPFLFGYLILTSRQLVCVHFASDLIKDSWKKKAAKGLGLLLNPLDFLVREAVGRQEATTHPLPGTDFANVPYPGEPLTPSELKSRAVVTNALDTLTSIDPIRVWGKDVLLSTLDIHFQKRDVLPLSFYAPHHAKKTFELLKK